MGFWSLALWLPTGLALEALHAIKAPWYLEHPIRREILALAHAHGTLLAVASLVLALAIPRFGVRPGPARFADRAFALGAVLLPVGFLLGGLFPYEGDPGIGILLTPIGGLLAAAGAAAAALGRGR